MIRHNSVVDGQDLPAEFYVPSSTRICPETDLGEIPRVTVAATEFSEDVAHTNIDLVKGYKALQNEFWLNHYLYRKAAIDCGLIFLT